MYNGRTREDANLLLARQGSRPSFRETVLAAVHQRTEQRRHVQAVLHLHGAQARVSQAGDCSAMHCLCQARFVLHSQRYRGAERLKQAVKPHGRVDALIDCQDSTEDLQDTMTDKDAYPAHCWSTLST